MFKTCGTRPYRTPVSRLHYSCVSVSRIAPAEMVKTHATDRTDRLTAWRTPVKHRVCSPFSLSLWHVRHSPQVQQHQQVMTMAKYPRQYKCLKCLRIITLQRWFAKYETILCPECGGKNSLSREYLHKEVPAHALMGDRPQAPKSASLSRESLDSRWSALFPELDGIGKKEHESAPVVTDATRQAQFDPLADPPFVPTHREAWNTHPRWSHLPASG